MSIWEKCEEHNAVPFFGFPLRTSFENGVITWEFPEGYTPNGSQTKEVAEKLMEFTGGEIIEVTDKVIKIKSNDARLADIIYEAFTKR
jgi:hypothetical protein